MVNPIVACVQPRMSIPGSHDEFVDQARRFLRQALAKSAQLVVFPELAGVMLAPPLISGLKRGLMARADQGNQPMAGLLRQRLGRVSGAAAGALGGFRGSMIGLLRKESAVLRNSYVQTFGALAREYGTAIVAGSLYLYDEETDTLRNRAYLFDADGGVLGHQDKFNLTPDEEDLAASGTDLAAIETRFGRVGLLIGRDALYPELARLLAVQGADVLVCISASPGAAQAGVIRSAMALRAEENQVYAAVSFLLGPNYLGRGNRQEYLGQSALLAPISLTVKGDGILVQAGTNRTEGVVSAKLDLEEMETLRQSSRFRPRQEMHLGNLGPVLAEIYSKGLSIEQAFEQRIAGPAAAVPKPAVMEPVPPALPMEDLPEAEFPSLSTPDALSLTGHHKPEEE